MAAFDEKGRLIPDQTPVEVPLRLQRPLSIQEEIKRFVRSELSARAEAAGVESFEDADDFQVEEDEGEEFLSPYEFREMQEEAPYKDGSELSKPESPPASSGEVPKAPAGAPTAPAESPVVAAVQQSHSATT